MKKSELNIHTIMMKKLNNERIDWCRISSMLHKADIDFIDEFHQNFYWSSAFTKIMPEEKITHMIKYIGDDYYSWHNISQFQKLSTDFMECYYQKLYKTKLARYQKLEEEFILKHHLALDYTTLLIYQELTPNVVELIKEKIPNAESILEYKKMYNEIIPLIENTKNNIIKGVGGDVCEKLKNELQRDMVMKLKSVLRKML